MGGVTLTFEVHAALSWLTAFPGLARELIAANVLMREDGSFVIGPASRTASGFFFRARPEWPGWAAIASEVEIDHVAGAMGLKLEINDGGPPPEGCLTLEMDKFGPGDTITLVGGTRATVQDVIDYSAPGMGWQCPRCGTWTARNEGTCRECGAP